MEFINLDIEKKVLRCLFFDRNCAVKIANRYDFKFEVFADKSIRYVSKFIMAFFHKNGRLATSDVLIAHINKYSTKSLQDKKLPPKKLEAEVRKNELFKEKLNVIVETVLNKKPHPNSIENFDVYVNELTVLYNGRNVQQLQMDVLDRIEGSDISGAIEAVRKFSCISDDDGVSRGEYTDDFKIREQIIMDKVNNPDMYELLATGIPELDQALGGGVGNEFIVVSGSSNAGKSMLMEQIVTNTYRLKKNVILVNIGEMGKIDTQNRIDCNIANVDHKFFRNPIKHYSKEVHDQWKSAIDRCRVKCGKFEIIEFRKSATVDDIMGKVYDTMNKWNVPLNGIFIDAIDNIHPKTKGAKDWMSYEEICWDLFLATKNFRNLNGLKGIPLFGATQLKKSNKEISSSKKTRELREDDVGSSPFQYRYSEVFLGIKTIREGIESEIQIMKGRSVSKATGIHSFHNFPYGRFYDEAKKKEFLESIPEEKREELEEITEIVMEE